MRDDGTTVDRQGLIVLDETECWRLLASAPIGRVAFIEKGEPWILPINHVVVDRTLAFLTAPGTKLNAAMMAEPVGFEVDGFETGRRSGWSVLMRGDAEPVYDEVLLRRLNETGLTPWAAAAPRLHWVRIRPRRLTGRRLP